MKHNNTGSERLRDGYYLRPTRRDVKLIIYVQGAKGK